MKKGFTLLELLLVLAMLGILLSLAWPINRNFSDLVNLEVAGRQILGQARLAQTAALSGSSDCSLRWLNLGGGSPAQGQIVASKITGGTMIVKSFSLPAGYLVNTNFTSHILNYTSEGTPSRGGTITLTSPAGRRRFIIASSIGRLRLSSRNE